ncbi:type II toxin-antitoxin system HicB family antitoxin [Terracidiphilus gabretensis]|uniref:type II toxin-antitoxin system HicB family antitoxin n=1 Tax=Terracidiphilus gabretensis TaxID=1577687 RepID=UPI00071B1E52|nr:type II toxin-antitoxin system HicB family antitoxin [Terracidiphilus gabretensis]
MAKTIEEYLALPYTIVLRRDVKDEIFVARVEELPGCSAHGNTEPEALSNLRDSMQLWIEDCIESGDAVPEPFEEIELPSGKWLQRVPRSLHLKLIHLAKNEGVSLNQFVTAVLAEAAGDKAARHDKGVSAALITIGSIDPWFIDSRNEPIEWEAHTDSALDRRKRDHGIRSLLSKHHAADSNLTRRGLKSGDKEETHGNWNTTQPLELVGR